MEPYWEQDFDITLGKKDKHHVALYQYSDRSVALVSTQEFGKSFAKNFKEINGKFNKNLKINDEPTAGWIFKAQRESLEGLNDILKKIFEGDIKPQFSGIIKPDFDGKAKNNKIFNLITMLMKLIPEETEQYILSEEEGVKTTIYFNSDEDTVTEGNVVYFFEGGKKKMEIFQLCEVE
jgi:hypothetical protein